MSLILSEILLSTFVSLGAYEALPNLDNPSDINLKYSNHLDETLEPDPIPLQGYQGDGITKQEFDEIMELGRKFYSDTVIGFGRDLKIIADWNSDIANASAGKAPGGTWYVHMYGGYGRLKGMTKDALTNVLCHEIGHLLAGFPFVYNSSNKLEDLSNEGQSDYYVGACFKKMFKNDFEVNASFRNIVSDYPKETCNSIYKNQEEQDLCYRTAVSTFKLWSAVGNKGEAKWGYENRDKSIVNKTSNKHPKIQCRVDTGLAGALCLDKWNDSNVPDKNDHNTYNCSRGKYVDDYRVGLRPKCWFKPDKSGGTLDPRENPLF